MTRNSHTLATLLLSLAAVLWLLGPRGYAQPAEFAYSLEDSVEAGGFQVRKVQDLNTTRWHVEILQGERALFRSGNGAKVKTDLLLGSFALLGDGTKQLLIEEYTGEAFCCTHNYVLRVGEGIDVLYSSSQYPVGYGLSPEDLDGDGQFELITTLTRFENFFNMPHEESPTVPVVFRYDAQARRYAVANRQFGDIVRASIPQDLERVKGLLAERQSGKPANGRWRTRFTGAVLSVALAHFYSGDQDQGWQYLLGVYDLEDRDAVLANLRYYLMRCPIFRGVYPDARDILQTRILSNQ